MAGSTEVVAKGNVAVVTGAASGIGLGLSERLAAEGMRVVMADVEAPALTEAADKLRATGAEILPVVTDVSKAASVDALRDQAFEAFGAVHLLCNNAGVGGPNGPLWLLSQGDWEWILNVNLWGVINGIRSFLPAMLTQDVGHVVNTASIFGAFAGALGPYGISKHAVLALSETLYFQLEAIDAPVGVSVLCPGAVRTNFATAERNRPSDAGPPPQPADGDAERQSKEQFERLWAAGMDPIDVAALVVEAIRTSRFYILTSTNRNESVRRRGEEIVAGGPPAPPFP
jgi:NAD(P)-dependent dehydrogenase (short-subunit alcohol dehydrogenase family)